MGTGCAGLWRRQPSCSRDGAILRATTLFGAGRRGASSELADSVIQGCAPKSLLLGVFKRSQKYLIFVKSLQTLQGERCCRSLPVGNSGWPLFERLPEPLQSPSPQSHSLGATHSSGPALLSHVTYFQGRIVSFCKGCDVSSLPWPDSCLETSACTSGICLRQGLGITSCSAGPPLPNLCLHSQPGCVHLTMTPAVSSHCKPPSPPPLSCLPFFQLAAPRLTPRDQWSLQGSS